MYPKAKALGIVYRGNEVLLERKEGRHSRGSGTYYRPIGGTIELGEKSNYTIRREFFEELSIDVEVLRYIACIENIYEIEGITGHEVTQIYELSFKDVTLYQRETFKGFEDTQTISAKWVHIKDFCDGKELIYPQDLINFLKTF